MLLIIILGGFDVHSSRTCNLFLTLSAEEFSLVNRF